MTWIRTIDEDEAEGEVREFYDRIRERIGQVPNIVKAHSLKPGAWQAQFQNYRTLMFGPSGLSREQREMIATVVSVANGCRYCTRHHGEALNVYWKDRPRLEKLIADWPAVDLDERDRAMIEHAVRLTREPQLVNEGDVQRLRAVGFGDEDILDITLIVAHFNSINRVMNGLGVDMTGEDVEAMKGKEVESAD